MLFHQLDFCSPGPSKHVQKSRSCAAASLGFKTQLTVAGATETRSTGKVEGFISQTLGFPFAFAAKAQDPAF